MTKDVALIQIEFLLKELNNKPFSGRNMLGMISSRKSQLITFKNSLELILKSTGYHKQIEELIQSILIDIKDLQSPVYGLKEDFEKIFHDYGKLKNRVASKGTSSLKQIEVVLLIKYLKEQKVFADISDTKIAEQFSELTGYSINTLRQKNTGKAKTDPSESKAKLDNYDKLKYILTSIINEINLDKKKIK